MVKVVYDKFTYKMAAFLGSHVTVFSWSEREIK